MPLSLNNTIVARIPRADLPSFKTAVQQALNSASDGEKVQWVGASKKKGPQIRASIEPLKTITTAKGNKCRFIYSKLSELSAAEEWKFWFCQQESGGWKVSGA